MSRASARRESAVIGLEDFEDAPAKRGYTTRHKTQEQQLRPAFQGRVRHWVKRWTTVGHLTVLRWERVDGESAAETGGAVATTSATAASSSMPPLEDQPRKRVRP